MPCNEVRSIGIDLAAPSVSHELLQTALANEGFIVTASIAGSGLFITRRADPERDRAAVTGRAMPGSFKLLGARDIDLACIKQAYACTLIDHACKRFRWTARNIYASVFLRESRVHPRDDSACWSVTRADDQLWIEVLYDGAFKIITDPISRANHTSAEGLLRCLSELAGGETVVSKRKEPHLSETETRHVRS